MKVLFPSFLYRGLYSGLYSGLYRALCQGLQRALCMGLCLLFGLFLTGCATFGQMDKGLTSLVGQKEQAGFDALGYPDNKIDTENTSIYIWTRERSGVSYVPRYGYGPYRRRTYYEPQTWYSFCGIKMMVRQGLIEKFEYTGNISGCREFITRLNEYVEQREAMLATAPPLEQPKEQPLASPAPPIPPDPAVLAAPPPSDEQGTPSMLSNVPQDKE